MLVADASLNSKEKERRTSGTFLLMKMLYRERSRVSFGGGGITEEDGYVVDVSDLKVRK